jgi:transposase
MLRDSYYTPLTLLDEQVVAALVPGDHYLRRVTAVLDFERYRALLAPCYSAREGRPADDPVLMVKLTFLQFQYGLSDREVIAEAQVNVAYRFFLQLSLQSTLPHPSLLSVFRTRLGPERFQQVFDDVVAQARGYGLVKDRLRVKDATHVIADIAIPSTIRLVAQTRQRLLEVVRPLAPGRVADEERRAAQVRQTTSDLPDVERLTQRVVHLQEIVVWVDGLVETWTPQETAADRARQAVMQTLALAHKVLADRAEPAAGDQVVSVVDPEARRGKHGAFYTGYSLDVAMDADSELITALNLLPANGDEAADATILIAQEEQAQGNDVQALSLDSIGWRGDLLRQWQDPMGLGLEVFVPPVPLPAPTATYTAAAFVVDAEATTLTCPGGQQTRHRQRTAPDTGWKFTFPAALCHTCPLQRHCLANPAGVAGRTVIKNDYTAEYSAARAHAQTPAAAQVRRQHRAIERKLAEMVRWQGGRRLRYRGRHRGLIQYLLTGMVVNVKRMVRLLFPPPATPLGPPVTLLVVAHRPLPGASLGRHCTTLRAFLFSCPAPAGLPL